MKVIDFSLTNNVILKLVSNFTFQCSHSIPDEPSSVEASTHFIQGLSLYCVPTIPASLFQ